jgi:type II secretory pathway predicted ATPase ExeA
MCSQPVAAEPGPSPPTGRGAHPGRLLRHAAWETAEAALADAVREGHGVVALLGGPGVGKTLMLDTMERRLHADGIALQRLDFGELASGAETAPVLLVDEAGRIEDAVLLALAEARDRVAVLAALPGFAARLEAVPHRVVRLPGLRAEDVQRYVAARLAALEVPASRMGPDAVAALGLESAGVPRLLNVLIGSSLFTAGLEKAEVVTGEHVRSAAGMHALSAVRVRVAEASRPPPARAGGAEVVPARPAEPEPAPPVADAMVPSITEDVPDLAPDAALPAAAAAPEPESRPARGILPWLVAGVVLGLIGAAGAWVMLGPGSAGTVRTEAGALPVAQVRPDAVPAPVATDEAPPEAPEVVPALPVAPPARIVLTYPRGDANAAARGEALALALRAAGRNVAAPFPVSQTGGEEVLRYFFLEDRDMALSIGSRAGQAPPVQRLGTVPDGAPLPRPGTVEWALPAAGGRAAARDAAVPERAAMPPPEPESPTPGAVLTTARLPLDVELRWRLPTATTASPCCFVEVMGLEEGAWQEVFSGYAPQADRHAVPLTAARGYAWRVTLVSRDGPRYAAGRWSRFTVQEHGG